MISVILQNLSPLIALFIFVLGNGLMATFLANELALRHISPVIIGLMTTFLYAGLLFGSFKIERIIHRVTHIRAYAAFASIIAIIPLLHMLYGNVYFWFLLRFFYGIATAGIFIVVESWLLCQSTTSNRGQILSLYMVTFYASQSLGQLLLKLNNHQGIFIFTLISILTSLSVLPMAMTQSKLPSYSEPSTLSPSVIYKKCASGLFGCYFAGLIMGALYGLFPVFLLNNMGSHHAVANGMFILILGGMLLQYPIGKLSDLFERRLVLLYISIASAIILLLMNFSLSSEIMFFSLVLFLGGCTFTLYPVSISYACDSLENKDIVSGTQTLLLAYSLGAMIGPVIASVLMANISWGLSIYLMLCCLTLILLLSWRRTVKEANPQEEQFMAMPQTSPIISEVDPRGEVEECN
jgi:MFS family permease